MESLQHITPEGCDFCDELGGQSPKLLGLPFILSSRVIKATQTGDLFAIPDASPISDRHGLIIPCAHFSRFSQFNCDSLPPLVEKAATRLSAGETLVFFEHGGHSCLRNGVCSEHAHLHLLAVEDFSMRRFISTLTQLGGEVSDNYDSIKRVFRSELRPDRGDYLVFGVASSTEVDIRLVKFDYVPSQILRYALADSLGIAPHIESLHIRREAFLSSYRWLAKLLPIGASRFIHDGSPTMRYEHGESAATQPIISADLAHKTTQGR